MRAVVFLLITIVISLVLILSASLGVGWILTLLLHFSLFEGTLLGMLAVIAILVVWQHVFPSVPSYKYDGDEMDFEPEGIPESEFWNGTADRTWENWFRYILANSIYEDFFYSPHWEGEMIEEQMQELSIRLAQAGIEVLKKKSPYAKSLRVSRGALRHEMDRAEQEPCDGSILDIAVASITAELRNYDRELRDVIREQLWDEPADVFW